MRPQPSPPLCHSTKESSSGSLGESTVRVFPLTLNWNGARVWKSSALRVTLELVFSRSMLQLPPLSVISWMVGFWGSLLMKLGISPNDSISERICS